MSALGSLVAGVAHEINNPTSCIIGNVNVAQDYFSDLLGLLDCYAERFPKPGADIEAELETADVAYIRKDLPKLIRAMKDAGDRIQAISKSLRIFSRVDKTTKQLFDIREGIESTLLILRHRLKANQQRPAIKVEIGYGDSTAIHCFPEQLNQVFMNILANAIDMFDEVAQQTTFKELEKTPQNITIRVKNLVEQNALEIRIADNGKGMPDEVKARIFDHLFTTKGIGKGTGLGLAIARQIVVDSHGGTLEVQSEVDQGAEFCVRLPL
ncbi:MAG: HAMP domain-containing histidine kinase [Cyanothece sp. SIO2G6]|nr:HAMP domain-containing histidine kinase [Cyanothece sp. SIO2G6]